MRLRTIWDPTINYGLRERLGRTGEAFMRGLAHRLPRRLAYWSLIDSGVRYTEPHEVVLDVPFTVVLERAGKDV
jgi:hypothetical protein